MPNFFPEGNSPLPTDSEERSLLKAVSLLQSIAAGGGGSGGGGNGSTNYELKSANFTAETGKNYAVDTTAGVVSVTLPSNPQTGDVVGFADARGTWASNAITILRTGKFIEGSEIDFSNNAAGTFFVVLFIDNSTGWRVLTSGTKPLNLTAPTVSGTYDFTSTNGTWTGSPTSFTYQWQMSENGTSGWTNIDGATSSTYLAVEADEGKYVRIGVIATNSNGPSVVTYSAASSAINVPDFPTTGLLAFWKLDDVNDASGNGNTLTNTNSVTFSTGKIGNAATFNASNYLSRTGMSVGMTAFTYSVWFNKTTEGGRATVFATTAGPAGFPEVECVFPNLEFSDATGPKVTGTFLTGTWTHAVFAVSNGQLKAYVNGSLAGTASWSHTSNATQISIGENLTNSGRKFDGKIDALGIWNRELSSEEIAQLYNSGNGVEP